VARPPRAPPPPRRRRRNGGGPRSFAPLSLRAQQLRRDVGFSVSIAIMAAASTEALIAVSGAILDRSEPLYVELRRLAPAAEGASAACRASLRQGTAAFEAYAAERAGGGPGAAAASPAAVAAAAAADARAASAALSAAAARAGAAAAARLAEGEARERGIEADAAAFSAALAVRRRDLEEAHKEKVKGILSAHGLSA